MAEQAQQIEQLRAAIAAQDGLRALLGDAVVETTVAALQAQIDALTTAAAPSGASGEEVPAADEEGERRLLSVLFADVVGSTSLTEQMDIEDWLTIIDGAYQIMRQTITRYEGRVAQFLGDGVLALFGVPVMHEDESERAVRAALEIQAGIARYALEVERRHGVQFAVRVGLHTGMTIVRSSAESYQATGETLTLASRLQAAAPPGRVLISHGTYRLVRGVFRVQPLGQVALAGQGKPVAAYVVEDEKPHAFRMSTRVVEGIETGMIGRDEELRALVSATEGASETGRLHWVTVIGEPGVGKSRLLYEYEKYVELLPQTFFHFKGRSAPAMQNTAYGLLRDCLAYRCMINVDDAPERARAKLMQELGKLWGTADAEDGATAVALIGHLIGFDFAHVPAVGESLHDARQLRTRALHALAQLLMRAAAQQPVAILLEDLHWADEASLEAVRYCAQACAETPLVLLTLARPEFSARYTDWGRECPTHQLCVLHPLDLSDGRALVRDILQHAEYIPPELESFIATRAEGNPYFVEELVKFLVEHGVIDTHAEQWQIYPERLGELSVPPTLVGLLQARLDALPAEARAVLQRAAVVGRIFWDGALKWLADVAEADSGSWLAALAGLTQRELVFRRISSVFAGEHEYAFKHALLRDVAYESVLKRQRMAYHRSTAEWLVHKAGARVAEFSGLIAHHYDQCGAVEEAVHYYRQAAEAALMAGGNHEAAEHFTRALALAPEGDSALAFDLSAGLERAHDLLGARAAQDVDLTRMWAAAERLGDNRRRARAHNRRAWFAEVNSDYVGVQRAAQAALAAAERAGDEQAAVESLNRWGRAYWRMDEYASAAQYFTQALTRARAFGDVRGEAFSLQNLAALHHERGEYDKARDVIKQALALCRAHGEREVEAGLLNSLAGIMQELGDVQSARTDYEAALAIHRSTGSRYGEAVVSGNLALVYLQLGDFAQARNYGEHALSLCRASDNLRGIAYSLTYLARVHEALGKLDLAEEAYREAHAIRTGLGQHALAIEDVAGLARVALARNSLYSARGQAETAWEYIRRHGLDGIENPFLVFLVCARVFAACGVGVTTRAVIKEAQTRLRARAALIAEPEARAGMLERVPENHALMQWEARPAR